MAGRTTHEGKKAQEADQEQDAVPRLLAMLSGKERIELENFSMDVGDLELWIPTGSAAIPGGVSSAARQKPATLFSETFVPPHEEYMGCIHEVLLGATKSEGGSRRVPFDRGIHVPAVCKC